MPASLLTRDELVERLLQVFRRDGFDGASLSAISASTGLGRSSLYHHFPGGKAEMAEAVLAAAGTWLRQHVVAPVTAPGPPDRRLRAALRALSDFYDGGRTACILERLAASAARRPLQADLRSAFALLIGAIADLLVEAGLPRPLAARRAEDAVVRIQGSLVVAAGLDDAAPFRRALAEIEATLLA